jgi:bifunctional polynucleotide phosphatase/kinase
MFQQIYLIKTIKMLQQIVEGLYAYVGASGSGVAVAAFDMDWTLTSSPRGRFPKESNDWKFLPNRLLTLKDHRERGHTIVIFTNQGYKKSQMTMALQRVTNILAALIKEGVNPWVFAATHHNIYRKPDIGMWNVFAQYFPNLDKNSSIFVGDSAGRPQDHSDNDIRFAQTIGLKFYTPEEIFPNNNVTIPDTQTLFIFVGMPGSGKRGWIHANQDILKTQPKVLAAVRSSLSAGKSVAVDATNPNPDKRREYVMIASQYQIPTLIIYFVRNGYGWNKLRPHPVPDIAYNMYYKNLVEPTCELDRVPVIEIF